MADDLKKHSRNSFLVPGFDMGQLSPVKTGALQRIADSLEKMEQPFVILLSEREKYERWWKEERQASERMAKTISSLRGVITRMKKKQNDA